MNKPLISIITVTYNAAGTLSPTMQSVEQQTFTDYEHLIIDGVSKDCTLEIAHQFATPRTIIQSEPDNGLYDAMNKGLAKARGKYVIFLNAGDSFHNGNVLSLYAEQAKKNKDIIYADTYIVDNERIIIGTRHKQAPETLSTSSWLQGMLICHQAFMVKKELCPEYSLKWRFSSDYEWTLECIKKTRPENCVNLHLFAIDYLNEGQTTANRRKSLIERFEIMRQHFGVFATAKAHLNFILNALKKLGK